jgi:hypothetical protein
MSNKIAVVGAGSAGILALSSLISRLPKEYELFLIYDPSIPIVGVGESTNPSFVTSIEYGLGFTLYEDIEQLDGTIKFGTKYIGWRDNDFINPFIGGNVAVHMDSKSFVSFGIERLKEKWSKRFSVINGNVGAIENHDDYASVYIDSVENRFDYAIDCRGWPTDYTNYAVLDFMPLNHCLIYNSPPKVSGSFGLYSTGHTATKDGWMFDIPLLSRHSHGYLFNDDITDIQEARENFAELLSIDESLIEREYTFTPYHAKRVAEGRVFLNGNRAFFYEPMFGNSLFVYESLNNLFIGRILNAISELQVNTSATGLFEDVAYHILWQYHGGSLQDTEFWRVTSQKATEIIGRKKKIWENFDRIKEANRDQYTDHSLGWLFHHNALTKLDKNFGYGHTVDN